MLERRGLGDVGVGELAVVRPGRGRARLEQVLGPANEIENVLEALLVEEGLREEFEPYSPPSLETNVACRTSGMLSIRTRVALIWPGVASCLQVSAVQK